MNKEVSIIHFPGSNCDRDLAVAIKYCLKLKPKFLWHNESHIKDPGIIFIPGGFSFGDYLRAGILATKSPAIKEVCLCISCLINNNSSSVSIELSVLP